MKIHFEVTEDEVLTPINVAAAIIAHTTHTEAVKGFENVLPEGDIQTFDLDELKEKAEHLLVYCNNTNRAQEG